MLGKSLPVFPSPDNQQLAPMREYDSHVSSLAVDRSIPLGQQAIRSQVKLICANRIFHKVAAMSRLVNQPTYLHMRDSDLIPVTGMQNKCFPGPMIQN